LSYILYINPEPCIFTPKCSFKVTNRVSAIPQLTRQQRWHTLVALPGQQTLARRDRYGLRPTPLGSNAKFTPRPNTPIGSGLRWTNENQELSSSRTNLVVPNLRRQNNSSNRQDSSVTETLQARMASAAAAAAARARVNKRR